MIGILAVADDDEELIETIGESPPPENYHYTSPTGSDVTGDGSIGNPWYSLSHACSQVNTPGHTIFANSGNYTDNNRASLSVGVNITGDNVSIPNITTNYVAASVNDAYLYIYSATLTNGNQEISYININGNNLTATRGVWVGYRYGVNINHCTTEDFKALGVHFRNQIDWMTPPVTYASGNSFCDNIVNNCSDRAESDSGNLRIDGQENMLINNCSFINNERAAGHNGDILLVSFCRGTEIKYCEFTKPDVDGSNWNFFSEIFHLRGGLEIHHCNFYGAACLDFSNAYNGTSTKGSYDFTFSVHDCSFTTLNGSQISRSGVSHDPSAIQFEKGVYEYCYIYKNHIKAYPIGIKVSTSTNYDNYFDHIYIHTNKLENIGYTDYAYTWGIQFALENNGAYVCAFDNIHIWNNTIYGGSGNNYNGIRWTANGALTNSSFCNNIIHSFDNYAVYFAIQGGESASMNNVDIVYSCFHDNGTNGIYIDAAITKTDVDTTTGNTTGDPLLISATDYHLSSTSSSAYHSGLNVGLTSDLDAVSWYNPPSMGCYEYV